MSPNGDARQMRASDSDRERVARVLQDAVAEGRISLEELGERLELTYRARTYADLAPITADLPGSGVAAPPPAPANRAVAATEAQPSDAERTLAIHVTAGSVTRRGDWRVPRRIEVSNPYGDTRLDFTEAILPTGVVHVVLHGPWGLTKLVLPDQATAAASVDTTWFGSCDSSVPHAPAPPAPHFRITGNVKGGSLKVRYRRRTDDWADWSGWG